MVRTRRLRCCRGWDAAVGTLRLLCAGGSRGKSECLSRVGGAREGVWRGWRLFQGRGLDRTRGGPLLCPRKREMRVCLGEGSRGAGGRLREN